MPVIEIERPDGPLEALLAVPTTSAGPWPGVVIVHDVAGFTADVRDISQRVADAGYLVITPNLYSRGGARCVVKVLRGLMSGGGPGAEDVLAARDHLQGHEQLAGGIGIAGFCMGGQFALLLGPKGFGASAPFYGVPLPRNLDAVLDASCPVVASFGARDPLNAGGPGKLKRMLEAKQIPHDLKVYPGVGHSFANKLPAQRLMRITGFGYDEDATRDAWSRVFAFFGEHLRPAAGR